MVTALRRHQSLPLTSRVVRKSPTSSWPSQLTRPIATLQGLLDDRPVSLGVPILLSPSPMRKAIAHLSDGLDRGAPSTLMDWTEGGSRRNYLAESPLRTNAPCAKEEFGF